LGPSRRLPPGRSVFFRYATPLGILVLIGLGLANNQYLQDNRPLNGSISGLLSIGAVLPVAIAVRRPLIAWRLAFPLLFLGPIDAQARESWPWPPVQIIGFLLVLFLVALTEDSGVTAWATGVSIVPPFLFGDA